ncbi:MAG: hypothetical protein CMJ78_07410 [Planctomycetaceae bacterium]|nr:hypothetical protein [Planctomycetaceae bacterium]
MSNSDVTPTSLKNDGDGLVIEWNDGLSRRITWQALRDACPCATCRTKKEEPQDLLPVISASEAQPIAPTAMSPMGNYAYSIHFNDGHNTGIYSLTLLRELGETQ